MKKFFGQNLIFVSVGLIAIGVLAPSAFTHAATFNNDPLDNPTLRVVNATQNPGCTSCWSSSVTANAGETIAFDIYYHNTVDPTALQTRVNVLLPLGNFTSTAVAGSVWAQNAPTANGTVSVSLTSSQTLSYIAGSVRWYPDRTTVAQPLLYGQNGSEIITSGGFNIGDIVSGWGSQGHVVFSALVSGTGGTGNSVPTITTNSATSIAQNSATLNGTVNPNGNNTTAWFEYGTTQSFGNTTSSNSYGNGNSAVNYNWSISGLQSGTTYYYRAVAQNSLGTVYGNTLSFYTSGSGSGSGCQPIVTTNFASFLTQNSATLRGLINPQGRQTTGWFEYGTSYSLGGITTSQDMGSNNVDTDLIRYLSGLQSNTTYYYRTVGENTCGRAYGSILSFSTVSQSGNAPLVTTSPASSIYSNSATVNGSVNPNGNSTTAWFEWGVDSTLGAYNVIPSTNLGSGTSYTPITGSPSPLSPNTTYYYRAVAQNGYGITRGSIMSFVTSYAPASTPSTPAPTSGRLPDMRVKIDADDNNVAAGQRVELTVDYRNYDATAVNALLKVFLPEGAILEDISDDSFLFEDNTLFFNLGRVPAGDSGSIKIGIRMDEKVVAGDELEARAELKYSSVGGTEMPVATDSETIEITDGKGFFSAAGLGFSLSSGGFWFFFLTLILLAIVGAVVYIRTKVSNMLKV